jgi:hypothetical protein
MQHARRVARPRGQVAVSHMSLQPGCTMCKFTAWRHKLPLAVLARRAVRARCKGDRVAPVGHSCTRISEAGDFASAGCSVRGATETVARQHVHAWCCSQLRRAGDIGTATRLS